MKATDRKLSVRLDATTEKQLAELIEKLPAIEHKQTPSMVVRQAIQQLYAAVDE